MHFVKKISRGVPRLVSVLDILGPKLSAYISEKVMALDEYDDIVDGYIEKSREIEDQLTVNE